jgi:hypothetical protein
LHFQNISFYMLQGLDKLAYCGRGSWNDVPLELEKKRAEKTFSYDSYCLYVF